jgi:hypothetical protein
LRYVPYNANFASFNLVRKHVPLSGVVLCLNRTLWGQFLREKQPFKKVTPKVGANIGAITGILLIMFDCLKNFKKIRGAGFRENLYLG